MKILAMIPARGGSKRIPRKNIKDFCGKPMLAYSVEAAVSSGVFDTVMVSTDDEEIAQIGMQYGAEVPFYRSEATSNDFATMNDVMLEVLAEYEKQGKYFDIICCVFPTAPFITAERLKEAVEKLVASDADTLIPVVAFSYPPQRALVERDGKLLFLHPEHLNSRSQDLERHYHDAGQFYVMRVEAYKQNRHMMLGNLIPLPLSELEVQDVDTQTDWELAELKYQLLHGKKQ